MTEAEPGFPGPPLFEADLNACRRKEARIEGPAMINYGSSQGLFMFDSEPSSRFLAPASSGRKV